MDVRSLYAAQKYAASRPAMQPDPSAAQTFAADKLGSAVQQFTDTMRAAETQAQEAMTGDADPHALVQALAQSELAVETVVAVRNKVVEAYQEILRMPV